MNQKIRIIFCICLTVVICFAVASAATHVSKKNSINRPDASRITTIKFTPSVVESTKTGSNQFSNQVSFPSSSVQELDFLIISLNPIKPTITSPSSFSARMTSIDNNENSEKPGLGFYLSTSNEKYGWIRGVFSRATVCKCCGIRRQAGRD